MFPGLLSLSLKLELGTREAPSSRKGSGVNQCFLPHLCLKDKKT